MGFKISFEGEERSKQKEKIVEMVHGFPWVVNQTKAGQGCWGNGPRCTVSMRENTATDPCVGSLVKWEGGVPSPVKEKKGKKVPFSAGTKWAVCKP